MMKFEAYISETEVATMQRISLNRNQIKYIVIIAMLMDHIAMSFFVPTSVIYQIMRFIGRLTGPTMAYLLAEGYLHTRNVKKYALRLLVFSVISWIPFSLLNTGKFFSPAFGVIFSLLLGLLGIWIWDKAKIHIAWKVLIIILFCGLSFFGDWFIFDILWPLFLFIYRDDPKKKWTSFFVITVIEILVILGLMFSRGAIQEGMYQVGTLMVPFMMMFLYNGESGSRHPFHKWFFYVFYPLHLLILALIKIYVF